MRNRRTAAWSLEAAPWSAARASAHVPERLHEWDYREADTAAAALTDLLVRTAVADGGRRVLVPLADQKLSSVSTSTR
ncbi:hypothetical protein [Streptomyces sp. G9]|uniref:hypothetical protein n=1 Tax=Streptomyces sp. G9 TaxID=1684483 RepID=UPI003D732738